MTDTKQDICKADTIGVILMSNLISRQAAIDEVSKYASIWMEYDADMAQEEVAEAALKAAKRTMVHILEGMPSVEPNIQTHLCNSCKYSYPDCPSKPDTVLFGNGKGHDNICACNDYSPFSELERPNGEWITVLENHTYQCSQCGKRIITNRDYIKEHKFCFGCGAKLRVRINEIN